MSFKEFSSTHGAPSKDSPVGKPKDAPVAGQPATQLDKAPAEDVTASKS